jgi:hypothetical protein
MMVAVLPLLDARWGNPFLFWITQAKCALNVEMLRHEPLDQCARSDRRRSRRRPPVT